MFYGKDAQSPKGRAAVDRALATALLPGEVPTFAGATFAGLFSPLAWLVVSNWRVLGLDSNGAVVCEVQGSDLASIHLRQLLKVGEFLLTLTTTGGAVVKFGQPTKRDVRELEVAVNAVRGAPPVPAAARAAVAPPPPPTPSGVPGATWLPDGAAAQQPGSVPATPNAVIIGVVSNKALDAIRDHGRNGEQPWFILGNGIAGALAAFEDRLLIVKVGALTSFMAGSMGGGRITTLYFRDITGIEFNAGLAEAVLEVSTPAYEASGNKDSWRGANASRNANSSNPWTLSNTLPINRALYAEALPYLNDLRDRISRSKQVNVHVATPAPAAASTPSAAQELAQLAQLHASGALSDDEFAQAKAAVLARM